MALFALITLAISAHAQLPAGTRPSDSTVESTPLAQAESALAAGHYDEAQKLLLAINPKDARAFYDLGYADEALHDDTAAEAAYRSAIAADPANFEAHAALGHLLSARDPAAARKELATALTLTPAADADSARAAVDRNLALLDLDANPTAATQEILDAIHLTREYPEDTFHTAQIAEKLGDSADAEATYRRALTAATSEGDAALAADINFALANLLIHEDKLSDAESLLAAALKLHPDDPPLTAQLARAYFLQGADDKALPLLENLHAKNPKDNATTRMFADACLRTGDAARADTLYQQLLAAAPNDVDLLTARGDSLIREKQFAAAQQVLEHADKLFLENPAALPDTDDRVQLTSSLAFAASENGEPSVVLTALDQRLLYAAETPSTLFLRATAHDHLHHLAQARSYYTQFLAAAQGKFPTEEWQAKHRLITLAHEK